MQTKTKAIVLSAIKYQEKSLIVKSSFGSIELANFFKDIFKIFFISLKIKQKKQQLTAVWQNAMHFATPCVSGN